MELLPILGAILMIWVVLTILSLMTYIGYDIKSRGMRGEGPALTVLARNGIGIGDYYRKKDSHPILDTETENIACARKYRIVTYICAAVLVVFVIVFLSRALGII